MEEKLVNAGIGMVLGVLGLFALIGIGGLVVSFFNFFFEITTKLMGRKK